MIMIRRLAIPLGFVLMLVAMALISPVLAVTICSGVGLLLGLVVLRALWRRRSNPPGHRSEEEEVEAGKRFIEKQRRLNRFQAIFLVYLVGVLYWIEGLTAPTVLFAVGGAVIALETLVVEPRIWASIAREKGFSLS